MPNSTDLWYRAFETQDYELFRQACSRFREEPNSQVAADNSRWFHLPAIADHGLLRDEPHDQYKDCKISVLVVGYSRPEGAIRATTSAMVTAARPDLLDIKVCTDVSDPLVQRYTALPETEVHVCESHRTSDKWNYMYDRCTGEIIVLVCDDVIFRGWGWDDFLRRFWPHDGLAVVNATGPCLLEFPIVSRTMTEKLGYAVPPEITHSGLDTFWSYIGVELGRYYFTPERVRIDHHHYETTIVHNRQTRYASPHEVSPQRLREIALTAANRLR